MDGPGISEEQLRRLTGVPRASRQTWADAGLLGRQTSPFSLPALREVVVLSALRAHVTPHAEVAYTQLRPGLQAAADMEGRIEAIVDLITGHAEWLRSDEQLVALARRGRPLQLVDMTAKLATATEGFELITRVAAAASEDELTKRRTRPRAPRRSRRTGPSS